MTNRVIDTKWRRVELVPMDAHCGDISLGLYHTKDGERDVGLVYSYSGRPEAAGRVSYVAEAMRVLGGLAPAEGNAALIHFSCGTWHPLAAKRLFLEATKHDPLQPLAPRPLAVPDTRTEQTIELEPIGSGAYRVRAEGGTADVPSRAPAIAAALAKLAELQTDEGNVVVFPCGRPHDALIALMLTRAQNLRAVLREEEMKASRGVLVAPSAQE